MAPQIPLPPSPPPRSELDVQARFFGISAGALALISLIQKVFHFGLVPVLDDIVGAWRHLTASIAQFLKALSPVELPSWYHDAFILSLIVAVAFFRAIPKDVSTQSTNEDGAAGARTTKADALFEAVFSWIASFIASILLLGSLFLFTSIVGALEAGVSSARRGARQHLRELFGMMSVALVFFVLNSKL
jgi:hypothetical protein